MEGGANELPALRAGFVPLLGLGTFLWGCRTWVVLDRWLGWCLCAVMYVRMQVPDKLAHRVLDDTFQGRRDAGSDIEMLHAYKVISVLVRLGLWCRRYRVTGELARLHRTHAGCGMQ